MSVFSIIALFVAFTLASSDGFNLVPTDPHEVSFTKFNEFFGKTHKNEEEKNLRFFNFLENMKKIEQDNINKPLGPDAYFGFTQFSDMTTAEFKFHMNGLKLSSPVNNTYDANNKLSAPSGTINWVSAGKTTAIKNQGACGSCWTFSAVETVESANLMAGNRAGANHGSEQELLDCCHAHSSGCSGGDPRAALQWVSQMGGIDLNSCYPYEGRNDMCRSNRCPKAYSIRGVYPIAQNENSIYTALQGYGPLSIGVDAEQWQNYRGGIISGNGCGRQMDHAVQLVGYQPANGGYWVVRNSWGPNWGQNGYIYLAFGGNVCGISTYVTAAKA